MFLLSASPILVAPAAHARGELVAGWEGDATRGYGFVAPALTVLRGSSGELALKAAFSDLRYPADGPDGETRVESPGVALGLEGRRRVGVVQWSVLVGYEGRRTRRQDPTGVVTREDERGLTVGTGAYVALDSSHVGTLYANYGGAQRYVWARAGVLRRLVAPGVDRPVGASIGVEATGQGNDATRAWGLGMVGELGLRDARASLQIHGGWTQFADPGRAPRRGGYLGVSLFRPFD